MRAPECLGVHSDCTPPIHTGARQHHRTSCCKHHRAGDRLLTFPTRQRTRGRMLTRTAVLDGRHFLWSRSPRERFWQGTEHGGTSHSTGRGREGTNSTTDDEDCAPTRNTKSPHPKTQMLNINRKPKEWCSTHPNCRSRSSLSREFAGGRSISLHTDVGGREAINHQSVGGERREAIGAWGATKPHG